MTASRKYHCPHAAAFTLIEMMVVIAILTALMTVGINLLSTTGIQSRKTGTDMLSGFIEQARTKAITSRCFVVLAIAEPGDLPTQDERARIGIFTVETWPYPATTPLTLEGSLTNRWQMLNTGIALIPNPQGEADSPDLPNVIDQNQVTITYGGTHNLAVIAHVIAFNPRGELAYPTGPTPMVFRLAEGGYRNGKATANQRGDTKSITESRLKIGRVIARPYQIDE